MACARDKKNCFAAGAVLVAVTLALFWPITSHPFIIFDDGDYIVENPAVTGGLSGANFFWAFGYHAANWHPLTWLSHQLDCTLFGLDAGKHHLVNALLHAVNALLVLLFLRRATGAVWRSAMVAALFAWHPLHVESVAWASERKDTLSTFFWLLTLLAYVRYAKGVTSENVTSDECCVKNGSASIPSLITHHSLLYYFAALIFFALGLMCKPMVVTLPCVLLLLDVWPLGRISNLNFEISNLKPLLLEKIPFFALSVAGSIATCQAQTVAMSALAYSERMANALLAYAGYVVKMFRPDNLAIVYSHPKMTPWLLALGALALLLVWTVPILLHARRRPVFLVGWLWFLGTLVPTIGLVQVGSQSMADRYTYIPSIGFFIVVVWGAAELFGKFPRGKMFAAVTAAVVLLGCLAMTAKQISYWRDSITLFRHALEVSPDNYVAANSLGKAYEMKGDTAYALVLYRAAVESEPRYWPSQFNLALVLLETGDEPRGWEHLQAAAKIDPANPSIQCNVGVYQMRHTNWLAAATAFRTALRTDQGNKFARAAMEGILREHPEAR